MNSVQYTIQRDGWPPDGRHILASFDDETIVVYQAYNRAIGARAIKRGRLGGRGFSMDRMSWIKTNFLWMMYRSGWGRKEGQRVVLGLRISRAFFEEVLCAAVASSFGASVLADEATWRLALGSADAQLQWDPDHAPDGAPLERRAIQLGLRRELLRRFVEEETIEVLDMTAFVESQRVKLLQQGEDALFTPCEEVYSPARPEASENVMLSVSSGAALR